MSRTPGLGAEPASIAGPAPDVPLLRVAAGVLRDDAGRYLIARRPVGAHAGGYWEFPGGKIRAGETPLAGLRRELEEELGIELLAAEPLLTYQHRYPERIVQLEVFLVADWSGEPRGLEGQPLQWLAGGELLAAGLLPADLPIVEALLAGGSRASRS